MSRLATFLLGALLLATPAFAADDAEDARALVIAEHTSEAATVQLELHHLSANSMERKLAGLFGSTLDITRDETTNTIKLGGPAHTVAGALELAQELDVRTPQVLLELFLLRPTKKGTKLAAGWLADESWSRAELLAARKRNEVTFTSAPSVTTVLGKAATIRDGACTPMQGEVPLDLFCPKGFLHSGTEVQITPTTVGDLLVLDTTVILRAWQQRQTFEQVLVLDEGQDALWVLPDEEQGDLYLFIAVSPVP